MTEAAPHVLSSENVEVLEAGTSVRDFIDGTVERLSSEGSEGPFFVADLDSVARRHLRWIRNLPGVKPFYAVKCNSSPAVIRTLNALGTGFDCASKVPSRTLQTPSVRTLLPGVNPVLVPQGEIQLALSLGVSPENIIFAHTTKAPSHLRFACSHGVNLMTFDSEEELTKISQCHSNAKRVHGRSRLRVHVSSHSFHAVLCWFCSRLVLRLAVDDSASLIQLSSKFGARREEVERLLRRALELGLDLTGVSFHVGCLCTDAVAFRKAIEDARQVFDAAFSRVISEALRDHFPADGGVRVIAEPGRYFVLSAFTLAASVIAKKVVFSATDGRHDEEQKPDRSMMYYINDGVHGSMKVLVCDPANLTVEPYLHRAVDGGEQRHRSVVWGPTCCAIDRVAVDCWFPELHVGDWLLVDNMGAYTLSLSTDFNGFERARVYTVATEETWRQLRALQR
ncbi:uncharacterized protein V6R79_025225 [Siganus canaliculatus]